MTEKEAITAWEVERKCAEKAESELFEANRKLAKVIIAKAFLKKALAGHSGFSITHQQKQYLIDGINAALKELDV